MGRFAGPLEKLAVLLIAVLVVPGPAARLQDRFGVIQDYQAALSPQIVDQQADLTAYVGR